MLLGSRRRVGEMMKVFLAQEELARRLDRWPGVFLLSVSGGKLPMRKPPAPPDLKLLRLRQGDRAVQRLVRV